MWKKEIHHQLGQDILPLRRKGLNFTWKTLDELRSRLVRATVYECGEKMDIEEAVEDLALESRPSLFDEELRIKPLPQAHMLLEWTERMPVAALLTDRVTSVELYVFRFSIERQRWRWPFIGMTYGPSFNDSSQVAVLEPTLLADSPEVARQGLVREHSWYLGKTLLALELVRAGLIPPTGKVGPTALALEAKKKHKQVLPTPSSLARQGRVRHEGAMTGKGAHRA